MVTKAQINYFLSDPDYLAVVGMEREHRLLFITDLSETRVSAFLAWLFRPQEGHGLGDQAFRELLLNAWRTNVREELGIDVVAPKDILECTFGDLLVHTEYRAHSSHSGKKNRPIDLVLVSRRNKLAVAVENKFGSGVHSDQLRDYRQSMEKAFPTYRRILVYLDSNEDNKPDDLGWVPLQYQWLIDMISTQQKAGLLSERSLDALGQFKDYLTEDVALTTVSESQKDSLVESIARNHGDVLDVFRALRNGAQNEQVENSAIEITEPLLIEYLQRRWLWNDVLDQSRHAAIIYAARLAFGNRLEVTAGPAEVRLRLTEWSRFEAEPDKGLWVPRVVAWSGRKRSAKYKVWAAANFSGVRPDQESEVRAATLSMGDPNWKRPPKAAQWMRIQAHDGLSVDAAAAWVVNELERLASGFRALA